MFLCLVCPDIQYLYFCLGLFPLIHLTCFLYVQLPFLLPSFIISPCPQSASLSLSPSVLCLPRLPFHPSEDREEGEDEGPFEVGVCPKISRHTWRPNWWCCPPATQIHTPTCTDIESPPLIFAHTLSLRRTHFHPHIKAS